MDKSVLGAGISFPIGIDSGGGLSMSQDDENVAESVAIIIGTAPGERRMRPDFGCRIHDFVFHPASPATAALVSFYVRSALVRWEPRIEDVKVIAAPDPDQENRINVDISYRTRRSNTLRNMVFPFYLRREQDIR